MLKLSKHDWIFILLIDILISVVGRRGSLTYVLPFWYFLRSVFNSKYSGGSLVKKKMDMEQKDLSSGEWNNQLPVNGNDDEFSRTWTGQSGTKRQTYYIFVDLISKLRGYAYWERRKISEVVNCALAQFFKGKEIKPQPSRGILSKKKR